MLMSTKFIFFGSFTRLLIVVYNLFLISHFFLLSAALTKYRHIYLEISFNEITFLPTFEKYKFAYTFSVTIIAYF